MRTGTDIRDAFRAISPRPTVLVEFTTGLPAPNDYIRLTSDPYDRSWSGATFTARPFQTDGFDVKPGTETEVNITVSDTDDYWRTWLLSTDFRWQTVSRYLIDRSETADTSQVIKDTWRVRTIARVDRELTFTCEPVMAILSRVMAPQERLTREEFPGIPADGDLA